MSLELLSFVVAYGNYAFSAGDFLSVGLPIILTCVVVVAMILFFVIRSRRDREPSTKPNKKVQKRIKKEAELKRQDAKDTSDKAVRLFFEKNNFAENILNLLSGTGEENEKRKEMQTVLLSADMGLKMSDEIISGLTKKLSKRNADFMSKDDYMRILKDELIYRIDYKGADSESDDEKYDREITFNEGAPTVILVVGVNGTGKTTTIGKIANKFAKDGKSVVLGAADTFRAAASEQLKSWGNISGTTVITAEKEGQDPASVAYKAVEYGKKNNSDVVIIDTAGRIHNNKNLMEQLAKIKRVVEKESNIDETFLVIDATTGQNSLAQSKEFSKIVDITGVILTKADGTAKGGIVFAVQDYLNAPVKFIGVGEGENDLIEFDSEYFVNKLLNI